MKTLSNRAGFAGAECAARGGGAWSGDVPVQAFVGMVSDEIEQLRRQGRQEEIARLITGHSEIEITADEIGAYYADGESRQGGHEQS